MAHGYRRLSFRARHIVRQLRKARNVALQRMHLHELRHAIARKHGFRGPKKAPDPGTPGMYQRLSRRGRHLLRRLRGSREWAVQKRTVAELGHEVERGARIAERREQRQARAQLRAERRAQRAANAAARARAAGARLRQRIAQAQERPLARAERRQRERQAGTRKPPLSTRGRRKVRDAGRRLRARIRPRRAPQAPRQIRPAPVRAARPAVTARPRPARRLRPVRRPMRARTR